MQELGQKLDQQLVEAAARVHSQEPDSRECISAPPSRNGGKL